MKQQYRSQKAVSSEPELSPDSNAFDAHGRPMNVIGWPGYRNAAGRSGLGYFETNAEWGHMQGLFIRWLALGKFRTHNPLYLLGMTFLGLIYGGIPLTLILYEAIFTGHWQILALIIVFPNIVAGILLLVNVLLSIMDWNGQTITGD
jgi:hypothetical protein